MEEQLLKTYHRQLSELFHTLENVKKGSSERQLLLADFNKKGHFFLTGLYKLYETQQADLFGREVLQKVLSGTGLQGHAAELFWIDQLAFYRQWLLRFENSFFDGGKHCFLKLSAKEILMLLRLAKDLELLGDRQLKPLFEFISLHIRTEKQSILSYESLRKKYSQIDGETLRQLKRLLELLIGRINHYFALLSNK